MRTLILLLTSLLVGCSTNSSPEYSPESTAPPKSTLPGTQAPSLPYAPHSFGQEGHGGDGIAAVIIYKTHKLLDMLEIAYSLHPTIKHSEPIFHPDTLRGMKKTFSQLKVHTATFTTSKKTFGRDGVEEAKRNVSLTVGRDNRPALIFERSFAIHLARSKSKETQRSILWSLVLAAGLSNAGMEEQIKRFEPDYSASTHAVLNNAVLGAFWWYDIKEAGIMLSSCNLEEKLSINFPNLNEEFARMVRETPVISSQNLFDSESGYQVSAIVKDKAIYYDYERIKDGWDNPLVLSLLAAHEYFRLLFKDQSAEYAYLFSREIPEVIMACYSEGTTEEDFEILMESIPDDFLSPQEGDAHLDGHLKVGELVIEDPTELYP